VLRSSKEKKKNVVSCQKEEKKITHPQKNWEDKPTDSNFWSMHAPKPKNKTRACSRNDADVSLSAISESSKLFLDVSLSAIS
jgi:hypothetical protein